MKLQIPNPKSQRSSKLQAPNRKGPRGRLTRYSDNEQRSGRINEASNGDKASERPFELEERTAQFGEAIVRFAKRIPRDPANDRLIGQLVGCGTSVGANYCEADERVSKKDFRNTIGRCVKEAKETKYFLRMIAAAEPKLAADARQLFREGKRAAPNFRKHLPKMKTPLLGIWSLELLWDLELGIWDLFQ